MSTATQLEFQFAAAEIDSQPAESFNYTPYVETRWDKIRDWCYEHTPQPIYRLYTKFRALRLNVKSCYQRMVYGVADIECWNLSNTIAEYTLPRLIHFKNMKPYGVPPQLGVKEWDNILDEIIFAFDYTVNEEKHNPMPDELLYRNRSGDSGNLIQWLNREKTIEEKKAWNIYMIRCDALEQRKRRGLKLFAEYFDNLWD